MVMVRRRLGAPMRFRPTASHALARSHAMTEILSHYLSCRTSWDR
jgi:hypothetical protein